MQKPAIQIVGSTNEIRERTRLLLRELAALDQPDSLAPDAICIGCDRELLPADLESAHQRLYGEGKSRIRAIFEETSAQPDSFGEDVDRLKDSATDTEPLRYRKYALPEAGADATEPHRLPTAAMRPLQSQPSPPGSGSVAPQGLSSTFVFTAPPKITSPVPPRAGQPSGKVDPFEEERIDIPGTHVPAWVVAALVVGVILVLFATAFLFLR